MTLGQVAGRSTRPKTRTVYTLLEAYGWKPAGLTTSKWPRPRFRSSDGLFYCAVGDGTVLIYQPTEDEHEEWWPRRKLRTKELDFIEDALKDLAAGKSL